MKKKWTFEDLDAAIWQALDEYIYPEMPDDVKLLDEDEKLDWICEEKMNCENSVAQQLGFKDYDELADEMQKLCGKGTRFGDDRDEIEWSYFQSFSDHYDLD